MESSFSPKITVVPKKMEAKRSPTLTAQKRAKKASIGSPEDLGQMVPLELPKPAVPVDESSTNTDPKPPTNQPAPEADSEAVTAAPKLPEPILTPTEERFVIFPIKHSDLWAKYKQHMAVFLTPEEIEEFKNMEF